MAERIEYFEVNSPRWLSLEDFEGEVWKDVVGFEGLYLVSNYGRIKTVARIQPCVGKKGCDSYVIIKEKIKKIADNGHGYSIVNLSCNNKPKMKYVHRLVAEAFIPNADLLPQINHKDENKSNNKVDNLEWCTCLYNNLYGTAKERSHNTYIKNGNNRAINSFTLDGKLVRRYATAHEVEKEGLSRRSVYNVCENRARSYKGLVYRFQGEPFSYRGEYKKGIPTKIYKYDSNNNLVQEYHSIKEAEIDNGLSRNYIYSATYARRRTAIINGYKFSYYPLNSCPQQLDFNFTD